MLEVCNLAYNMKRVMAILGVSGRLKAMQA
jgi:hypothetical protein